MIKVVGLAILCVMLTFWFSPIQSIKMKITSKMPDWMATPFICSKCCGFWVGLIVFQDIFLAAITSFTAYVIDNIIYYIEDGKDRY